MRVLFGIFILLFTTQSFSQSSAPVDEFELERLRELAPQSLIDSDKPSLEPDQAQDGYYYYRRPVAYCQAWSYVTGRRYYWYSYNMAYSRYRVVQACTLYNGYTCRYVCAWR